MAKYKLTNKAVEDLTRIWADDPNIGKNYEGIKDELFGLKANRHIIFYLKSNNNTIEITRLLHERMDLKNKTNE
jgi:toxin ParE1/3/4